MSSKLILITSLFIFCVGTALAGPYNIAGKATVTVSSVLGPQYGANNVTDGIIAVPGKGEWASKGDTTDWGYLSFPWVKLEWQQPQTITRIVLYDRPNMHDHIAGGKLYFSDGTSIMVNAINNDGTGKEITFPEKTISWVRFETTDGDGRDLGFSEIEVFPSFSQATDYVSWVDPYIETNRGRYFFFVTGGRPFGMVAAAPLTRNKNQNGGGYNYNENEILGFEQIHTWMISGIEVMPTSSDVNPSGGKDAWKSRFSHEDEIVQPGYQRVYLQKYKTWVENTATERVSFYRFTYTQDMEATILTNLGGYVGSSTMANAQIKRISNTEFEGSFSSVKRYWGGPKDVKVYFVIQFDKPYLSLNGWRGSQHQNNISEWQGDSAGVAALYNVKAGDQVQMKIGMSYTTIENARKNLQAECTTWNFNEVRNETQKIWNEWLGKMEVKGGTTAQKIKFYTDIWHAVSGRKKIDDVSGDYPDRTTGTLDGKFTNAIFKIKTLPKNDDGTSRFHMYNSDALWLTQWNLNILWGLAWPEVQDELSASMVQYADNGYLLPRGPCGGGYSYIMTSCPASNLITSTFQKGLLTKVDANHAFDIIKQNHLPGGMLGMTDTKGSNIKFYTKKGWWPDNVGITIEATFQDWGAAQMARKLGRTKDYKFFNDRSNGWKYCFDPKQKLLFPKDKKGNFIHLEPLNGEGWVEANAWQGTWGISHDIPDLAKMMGGNDTLAYKLNHAFEMAAPSDFVFDYSGGYISYANQPGCSDAHVFNYAQHPWLTQYWVRKVQDQAYSGITPDEGYGGHDEDEGQMGGVSALMSIGLFNIQGNQSINPVYDITSPIFDEVTIHLDNKYYPGKQFVIKTYNNAKENYYIQKAQLNGQPLNTFWFTHAEYIKGGLLELWLGPEPNKEWGVAGLPVM